MNILFCADAHLGHKNIHKFRSVESCAVNDETFLFEAAQKLNKRCITYFLGDVAFDADSLELVAAKPLPTPLCSQFSIWKRPKNTDSALSRRVTSARNLSPMSMGLFTGGPMAHLMDTSHHITCDGLPMNSTEETRNGRRI